MLKRRNSKIAEPATSASGSVGSRVGWGVLGCGGGALCAALGVRVSWLMSTKSRSKCGCLLCCSSWVRVVVEGGGGEELLRRKPSRRSERRTL